ncbi:MAG: MarR family transcriptional regulator [Candidatus Omnitrophica bacterium]|nr:MarR family transcriptional regulator [Candidatus Omnitrophota bacterium]MCM8770842.1 MarR family transcriptional regulator [Candidatus Omnitrophota bacterium]
MQHISLSEFADKINEIMPVIAKEFIRQQTNELFKGKITLPQFFILEFLYQRNDARMSDLAKFMRVTTAAMTGIVDRLVRDNYAIRVYDPKDRRIIKIKLTDKGNTLVKKINEQRRKMVIDTFAKVSEFDRQQYLRILLKIKDILTKEKEMQLP